MSRTYKPTRREFLSSTGLVMGATLAGLNLEIPTASAQRVRVRPNIASLSEGARSLQALRDGVAAMRSSSSATKSWEAQAHIHDDYCPHGNWFFLPWHRAYLLFFEQICREASGWSDFMLPYWDWSANPTVPDQFWTGSLNDPTRLVRSGQAADARFVGPTAIENILRITDFATFGSQPANAQRGAGGGSGRMEATPHNYIHGTFVRGDMATYMSPLDPVFWLHHANIDRLWTTWDLRHPGSNPSSSRWLNFNLNRFFNLQGNRATMRVSNTLSTYNLGYRYPTQPATPPNVNQRRAPAPQTVPPHLRVQRTVRQEAKRSAPVTTELPLSSALRQRVSSLAGAERRVEETTLRLRISVEVPEERSTGVNVFINPQSQTPALSESEPGYVGTVTFFNATGGHNAGGEAHPRTANFLFDVSSEVQSLARGRVIDPNASRIHVSVVPEALEGESRREAAVKINDIALEALA